MNEEEVKKLYLQRICVVCERPLFERWHHWCLYMDNLIDSEGLSSRFSWCLLSVCSVPYLTTLNICWCC